MNAKVQEARERLAIVKSQVSEMLKMIHDMPDKHTCTTNLLAATYSMLTLISNQDRPDKDQVMYMMGHVLPLLDVIVEDRGMLDEGFCAAVVSKMHVYYTAYIKDIEATIGKYESMHSKKDGSIH